MKEQFVQKTMEYVISKAKEAFVEALPVLIEKGKEVARDMLRDAKEEWLQFRQQLTEKSEVPENLIFVEEEFVNKEKLVALAKQSIVPGSNEVYAWKKEHKSYFLIHLAYGLNGEPLDKAHNRFVNIKAEGLSKDVLNLFGNSELIILQ